MMCVPEYCDWVDTKLKKILDKAESEGKKYILYKKEGKLWQIVACRNFDGNTPKGEVGGYIESEKNLSHEGKAWVGCGAKVYQHARVQDNALVRGCASVGGYAIIKDEAQVHGRWEEENTEGIRIHGHSVIRENAMIHGGAEIYGEGIDIHGEAFINGQCEVSGCVEIYEQASVGQYALVTNHVKMFGESKAYGNVAIRDYVVMFGKAQAYGNALLEGYAQLSGNAQIFENAHTFGHPTICGSATILGNAEIGGVAWIGDMAIIDKKAVVDGDMVVKDNEHLSY